MGWCATVGHDPTKRPDGAPCDPTMHGLAPGESLRRNIQCRGACFGINPTVPSQGICGSHLALSASPSCPDGPATMAPETPPAADDLTLCIIRRCVSNTDCMVPHVCRYLEDGMGSPLTPLPPYCQYPSPAQPRGIP
jgi:hypothetical protein